MFLENIYLRDTFRMIKSVVYFWNTFQVDGFEEYFLNLAESLGKVRPFLEN